MERRRREKAWGCGLEEGYHTLPWLGERIQYIGCQSGVLVVSDVILKGIHDRIQPILLRKAYGSKKLVYA